MPLMDSEQLDKEHHRVVFSQPMFIAPLGNGLGELLVKVRLFCLVGLDITSLAVGGRRRIRFRRKACAATFGVVAGQAG